MKKLLLGSTAMMSALTLAFFLKAHRDIEDGANIELSPDRHEAKSPQNVKDNTLNSDFDMSVGDFPRITTSIEEGISDAASRTWWDYHSQFDKAYENLESTLQVAEEGGYLVQELFNQLISADDVVGLHTLEHYMSKNNVESEFLSAVQEIVDQEVYYNINSRVLKDMIDLADRMKGLESVTANEILYDLVDTGVDEQVYQSYMQRSGHKSTADDAFTFEQMIIDLYYGAGVGEEASTNSEIIANFSEDIDLDTFEESLAEKKIEMIRYFYNEGMSFERFPKLQEAADISNQASAILESLEQQLYERGGVKASNDLDGLSM